MSTPERALVFPGQGRTELGELRALRDDSTFAPLYESAVRLLALDPLAEPDSDADELLAQNRVSSLLTVVASLYYLHQYRNHHVEEPLWYAGYSVGQFTALHAAGALSLDTLLETVLARATYMDTAARKNPGGMLAVIGVAEDVITAECETVSDGNARAWISNYNAPGFVTVAGNHAALDALEVRLAALSPKKLDRLPVAGPWHCPLMGSAVPRLEKNLAGVTIEGVNCVMDNVTGEKLPADLESIRNHLCRHLVEPVQWSATIRNLAAAGVDEFVEIGHGDLLTKFGLFTERNATHIPYSRQPELA